MEIMEIVNIQKNCRKQAKAVTKEVYSKYDAIWTDGIKITPELAALGENVIGDINRKMPNMLMRNHERPEVGEIAERYGFESSSALVEYLLNYEPRKYYEEKIYQALLQERFVGCSEREIEIATTMKSSEITEIVRNCNRFAKEITEEAYEKYDEIWAGKIRITSELLKHGRETVSEINRKMPNMLTHDTTRLALDQVAMIYDFETSQDLVDWLLEYRPRTEYQSNLADQLAREQLGLITETEAQALPAYKWQASGEPYEIDEVPF